MGNKIKWIASLGLGLTLLSGGLLINNSNPTPTETHVSSSSYTLSPTRIRNTTPVQIAIQDSALSTALRNLLGKGPTDLFYTTDFLNHEDFKATSITDEESGVTIVTSKIRPILINNIKLIPQALKRAVENYYVNEFADKDRQLEHNLFMAMTMLLLGILGFTLLYFMNVWNAPWILCDLVDVAAWVFIWETVDLLMIRRVYLKLQQKKDLKIIFAKMTFKDVE